MKKKYIDKTVLVTEISKRVRGVNRLIDIVCDQQEDFITGSCLVERIHCYDDILELIDTLEVMEL